MWWNGTPVNLYHSCQSFSCEVVFVHSGVMRDVHKNCDSNNTTHVGQPQRRDVTKAAPLHWFETVGPGGHWVTWDRGPGEGRVLVQLVDMTVHCGSLIVKLMSNKQARWGWLKFKVTSKITCRGGTSKLAVVDNLQSKRDLGTDRQTKGLDWHYSENRFKEVTLDQIKRFARQDVRGCEWSKWKYLCPTSTCFIMPFTMCCHFSLWKNF